MNSCAWTSTIMGAVLLGIYIFPVWKPEVWRKVMGKFPRSVWPGRILIAIDLIWVAYLLFNMNLGKFSSLKPAIYGLAPVSFFLIIFLMHDLLAPRALGGLMLLIANPILNNVRWNESPLRLILVVSAYIIIIKGMILVLSPYQMRRAMNRFMNTDQHCRRMGSVGMGYALLLLALGLFVF